MAKEDNKKPMVVIVLLTLNQKENTLNCLRSLSKISYNNYKVIVVDNNSDDGTFEEVTAKFPDVIILRADENLGCSKGRNLGINYALDNLKFKYYLFLDNDTIVKEDFLNVLVDEISLDDDIAIVHPKIYYLDEPKIIQHAGNIKFNFYTGKFISKAHQREDDGTFDTPGFNMICSGTCFLIRKDLTIRIKGYDPIFDPYGYEDLDLILRGTKKSGKIKYCPKSVIYHKESRTPTKGKYNQEFAKLKARNLKIFMKRHSTSFQRIIFYLLAPFLLFFSLLRTRDFNIFFNLIKSYVKR